MAAHAAPPSAHLSPSASAINLPIALRALVHNLSWPLLGFVVPAAIIFLASLLVAAFADEQGGVDQLMLMMQSAALGIGVWTATIATQQLTGQGVTRRTAASATAVVVAGTAVIGAVTVAGLAVAHNVWLAPIAAQAGTGGSFMPHVWDSTTQVSLVFAEQLVVSLLWGTTGVFGMALWFRTTRTQLALLAGCVPIAVTMGIQTLASASLAVWLLAPVMTLALIVAAQRLLSQAPVRTATPWNS